MRGLVGGSIVMFLVVAVISLIFVFEHVSFPGSTPQSPTAQLCLSQNTVSVTSNSTSTPISVCLTGVNYVNSTGGGEFTITLAPSDPAHVYAIYYNNTVVSTIATERLYNNQPYTSPTFRIFGKLPDGQQGPASFNITVSLYYNNDFLSSQVLKVTVNQ